MAFATIPAWSTTAGTNTEIDGISLAENVMVPSAVNNAFREMMSQVAEFSRRGTDLASAATLDLDSIDTMFLDITGAVTVTAVTLTDGHSRRARATGAFLLTASASLVVNGSTSSNYTTTAGDLLFFEGYATGVVRVWAISGGGTTIAFATNAQAVTGTSTVLSVNPANLLATRQLLNGVPFNLGLAAAVGANALTISLKGADGNDPSATNPVEVPFRNVTAATGTPTVVSVTAATSLVISSGSTLGAPTGSTPFKVWVVAFNDAGTVRLAAILCTTLSAGILTQFPLAAWGIASSTAEGGAGAADTAQTFYTGTAVTSKAYAVIGVLHYETGLATAGTWAAAPTRGQLFDSSVPLPGERVGGKTDASSALASTATTMPYDDTIPQNTEGAQFLAPVITPSSAANIMRHAVDADFATATGAVVCGALFKDSTAGAFAACAGQPESGSAVGKFTLTAYSLAEGTAAVTYKFRAGPSAANTLYLNGNASGVRIFGGVCSSVYEVQEIAA